ncbi:MAG: hypothetical protein GY838_16680 [bacterium]|nr:hypothetical protein [bacterium]
MSLTLALILVSLIVLLSVLTGVRSVRQWRQDIIDRNMALTADASRELAGEAEDYFRRLPAASDGTGLVLPDSLDLQLALMTTRVFAATNGLKGGFWVIPRDEFMGYANPWSPPPQPVYGPPPRSQPIIQAQVEETIRTARAAVHLHEFESVSVSGPVFPLATEPVMRDGHMVAVVWARIHIEAELPAAKLGRYLNVTALVAVIAFVLALVATLHQRREIHSLKANLELIEQDPSHRMTRRRGMFGSIRLAINRMLDALEAEFSRSRSLEEKLHQQDKMASLGNLLAGVAHEVKTPLAILKTRVQIWQRDLARFTAETRQPAPLTDESMQLVLDEINRLSDLLRKLLYFSRPVRTDLMKTVEADDLVRSTVLFIRPRLLEKRIDLELDLAAPGAALLGDPDALHQVFLNILTNSVDALDDGGRVAVSSRVDGNRGLAIDLEDTGAGLDPGIREQAFTPFYTTRHGGSGLGLSTAYEIVKAHHGTIEFVDPVRLAGAHCRVTLPLESAGKVDS